MASKKVGADGTVRLPMLEAPVRAVGVTPDELYQTIVEAYRLEGTLDSAQIQVSVRGPDVQPPPPVAVPAPVQAQPRSPSPNKSAPRDRRRL